MPAPKLLACVVAIACAVLVAVPAPASAAPSSASGARSTPTYVALGDSVAAGYGASSPAKDYVSVLRDRLTDPPSCAPRIAPRCRLELENLAVSGATTTSLMTDQLPAAARLLLSHNHNRGRSDDVTLITLDIGGNDLFRPVAVACIVPGSALCAPLVQILLAQFQQNFNVILAVLRRAAGPSTTIAVMTYYNPLPACFLHGLTPIGDIVLEGGGPIRQGLNDIIRSAAARYGAVVAEPASLIANTDLLGGFDCLHPNDSGHADIATAFQRAIEAE
jgi:lysophospholipase L1-like esterase